MTDKIIPEAVIVAAKCENQRWPSVRSCAPIAIRPKREPSSSGSAGQGPGIANSNADVIYANGGIGTIGGNCARGIEPRLRRRKLPAEYQPGHVAKLPHILSSQHHLHSSPVPGLKHPGSHHIENRCDETFFVVPHRQHTYTA